MSVSYPCPCLPSPICPPPKGNNGVGFCGETFYWKECIPDASHFLKGPGGGTFNGAGSVIGGKGPRAGNSPGPDRPPLPERLPTSTSEGPDFGELNYAFIIYDESYNYQIATNSTFLDLANEEVPNDRMWDPAYIFKSSIPKTLADILNNNGGSTIPFNGVTLGAFLYNPSIISDSLNETTRGWLNAVKSSNIASHSLPSYLLNGIWQATMYGDQENYPDWFFDKILDSSSFSLETKDITPISDKEYNRNTGYQLREQFRESLASGQEVVSMAQQNIRLAYIPPTDIDLCFSVTTQGGETGIRVSDANTISIIKQDATTATITEKNEFYSIIKQDNTEVTVALPSRRNEAYYTPVAGRGILDGMFYDENSSNNEYTYTITAETDWGIGEESVEVTGGGVAIPEGMLYTLIPSSIEEMPPSNSQFRTTEATYKLAWQEDDSGSYTDDDFNAVVSGYSGPRTSIYINPKNPFIDVMLIPNADGNHYLKLTFNDLNLALNGVYPRQIFSDFMIFAANNPIYDPYYGIESTLDQYTEGLPVKRSIQIINNPFGEVQNENYVASILSPTGRGVGNEPSPGAFVYNKNFSAENKTLNLSKTGLSFTSQKSILGTVLDMISTVDTNYDLQDGQGGKQLPQGDLFGLLTMPQIVSLIKDIPQDIVSKIWNGTYNDIKIIPIKRTDLEKTYLTTSRLKSGGTDLVESMIQVTVPDDLGYVNQKYFGKLFAWPS